MPLNWKELAIALHDPDSCEYDHHGFCQTHGLHEEPCPHGVVQKLLASEKSATQSDWGKEGDVVTRMLGGSLPMKLRVTKIENGIIECGDYTFDEKTGAEIDDFLDWGPPPKMTGSFLLRRKETDE